MLNQRQNTVLCFKLIVLVFYSYEENSRCEQLKLIFTKTYALPKVIVSKQIHFLKKKRRNFDGLSSQLECAHLHVKQSVADKEHMCSESGSCSLDLYFYAAFSFMHGLLK